MALNAERDGFQQAWSGVRTSTVLADTTLDGRLYWIVADSMDVRLETSALEYEWGWPTSASSNGRSAGFDEGAICSIRSA